MSATRWLVLWLGALAGAQDPEPAGGTGGGEYAFDDDELVIVGEIQKPEVTVVISRENLNKRFDLELKESFLPAVVDAVKKAPF